jgi:hypothetical protein
LENLENKIFIICPVEKLTKAENSIIQDYIRGLKSIGVKVHYPPEDTHQEDPIGLNICSENRAAIKSAIGVSLYYNPTSKGTVFDIGMAFMANKPLFIINPDALKNPNQTELETFLEGYAINTNAEKNRGSDIYKNFLARAHLRKSGMTKLVEYEWKDNNREFLFDFGMTFMAEKPIRLLNREYVETQRTPGKSFQNVLLALDDIGRKAKYF